MWFKLLRPLCDFVIKRREGITDFSLHSDIMMQDCWQRSKLMQSHNDCLGSILKHLHYKTVTLDRRAPVTGGLFWECWLHVQTWEGAPWLELTVHFYVSTADKVTAQWRLSASVSALWFHVGECDVYWLIYQRMPYHTLYTYKDGHLKH